MSLFAASSAASRHLRRHLMANVDIAASAHLRICTGNTPASGLNNSTRHFSSKGGSSGLRRTQAKGRRSSPTPKSAQQSTTSSSSSSPPNNASSTPRDPHSIANEMVSSATTSEGRTPGTESLAKLTNEQKMSNFAMAGGLFAFVSYIFYYSLSSVGGDKNAKALLFGTDESETQQQNAEGGVSNPGFEEFLKEANEGRTQEEKRLRAEREAKGEARELVSLESSTAARLKAEGVGEDVIVAGSANEEEEREMARVAGFVDGEDGQVVKKRPLWKRVVFFWRRE